MVVVTDGEDAATAAVVEGYGCARLLTLAAGAGANAKRNAGAAEARGELIVFIDDDVEAPPGWLAAVLAGSAEALDYDVFGGRVGDRARAAARALRSRPSTWGRRTATLCLCGAPTWRSGGGPSSWSDPSTRRWRGAGRRRTGSTGTGRGGDAPDISPARRSITGA